MRFCRCVVYWKMIGFLVGIQLFFPARTGAMVPGSEQNQKKYNWIGVPVRPLGKYPSPDGQYQAVIRRIDEDSVTLSIYKAPTRHLRLVRKNLVLPGVLSADNFAWIPKRAHTLVFAVEGDYGKAMLAMWNGGKKLRMLRPVYDADAEFFEVEKVSSDGRQIVYHHANFGVKAHHRKLPPGEEYKIDRYLVLPPP